MHQFAMEVAKYLQQQEDLGLEEGDYYKHLKLVEATWENVNDVGKSWVADQVQLASPNSCSDFVTQMVIALTKVRAESGKTPHCSHLATDPSGNTPTRTRLRSFKDDVLLRDGPYCKVRGFRGLHDVVSTYMKLEDTSVEPPMVESNSEKAQVCHLIPHALGKGRGGTLMMTYLQCLTGISILAFSGDRIDSPANGVILSATAHDLQGRFGLTFKPLPSTDTYKIVIESQQQSSFPGLNGKVITFHPKLGIPTPSKEIMELLYVIYCISHANAAAEEILLPALRFDSDEVEGLRLGEGELSEGMALQYLRAQLTAE